MRRSILLIVLLLPLGLFGQDDNGEEGGDRALGIELGIRNTYSLFGNLGNVGTGFGGQFRIKPGERWNTEWYLDYIKTDIDGLGHRETMHIGWSVMFYFLEPADRTFKPYLLAGHCFDYAKVLPRKRFARTPDMGPKERWSSAVQVGVGTHLMMSEHFDLSVSTQYMSHLGNDLKVEKVSSGPVDRIRPVEAENGLSLEGHLLTTLSMNLYILPR